TTTAPVITSAAATTFTAGQANTFTITANGVPTPSLKVTGSLPAGGSFQDNGDGTATLSGPAAATAAGQYSLTITATNGAGPAAPQPFTLPVNAPVFATAADAGGGPDVKVFSASLNGPDKDQPLDEFFAFDMNFTGGVRVAVGDVNGDAVADIICGAGPG